mgnify:FL=1
MAAKKTKKPKRPKFIWPKRTQNKDLLKVKDRLSNAEVIKRLTLDKDEKKTFNALKTGRGKWTITTAAQNENSGWQRYLATKNKYLLGWKEGLVNEARYHVSWNINKKIDPPKRPKAKKTKVKKSKKAVKTKKDPEK